MITVSIILIAFVIVGIIAAIVTGLIAISPVLLVLLALPVIDCLVLRKIFKRKK